MKSLIEEIRDFDSQSRYSNRYKEILNERLTTFVDYLANVTDTPKDELHLEKIYETVNKSGQTLFYSKLDVELLEQYFKDNLDQSYKWLIESKRALRSLFKCLHQKYDFPVLTDEMGFNIDEHKPKPQKKEKYVPTRHDLLRFLQVLLHQSSNLERDALFFLLLMSTGSRPSEIINTKIHEIDLINETIYRQKTKNKSSKFIVLRSGFGEVLERYIHKNNLSLNDYLINNNGPKMTIKSYQEIFNSFLEQANLPHFTLHKFRHAFATMMIESGAEIMVIQQLLGHKKIQSTKNYIHPNYVRNEDMEISVNKEVYEHIRKL